MSRTSWRRGPVLGSLAVILTGGGLLAGLTAAASSAPPPPNDSSHANVLAQGVVQVGTGSHVWVLQSHAITQPVDLPAAGPTYVVPTTGPVRLLGPGGAGLGAYVEPGEAAFVPAGEGHHLTALAPTDVLEVGLSGGEVPGAFPLAEGYYDFELLRDVLAPGERLPVSGAVSSLVLVTAGTVTLPDGGVLPAGYNLGFTSDFSVTNAGAEPAVVLVAALSTVETPAQVGAPLPAPVPPPTADGAGPGTSIAGSSTPGATPGAPTVGDTTPGNTTPGNSTPGNSTPGNSTPGDTTPGNSTPGDTTPGSATTSPASTIPSGDGTVAPTTVPEGTAPPTTPPPTTAPPTTAPPTAPPTTAAQQGEQQLVLELVSCNASGTSLDVFVDARAGNGYRRNVRSVTLQRENNEGAYTSPSSFQWIGEDTADHDEWSIRGAIGQRQDMGDGVRIVAKSEGGQTATINTTVSACQR